MQSRAGSQILKILFACFLICIVEQAQSEYGWVFTEIYSVEASASDFLGGCRAYLSAGPESVLPSCRPGWVTFSCTGEFTEVLRAIRLLDMAQMAYALGDSVWVGIQDDKTHNGYCFAHTVQPWR